MKTKPHTAACGTPAAGRLAPYEPRISANFELARHVGKHIACWDTPAFVAAADAAHMRSDDYVVGLEHKGRFRAYPLWITDNYHMINDTVAGDPVLFSTCERCQSGSAFLSLLDGEPVKFSALGMYNASLTMVNRRRSKTERHSLWLHYEGVAIDGPLKGQLLEQLPTYHTTWGEWAALHPETDVMLPPDDPYHRDARHGHGREEIFSRPGMDPPLAKTITGRFDDRYPENEIVLGINVDAGTRAYPLLEVKRAGGAVNDALGDVPVAVFAGPRPEQITMSAFARVVEDRVLTFESAAGQFRDRETGTTWTIEGRSVEGPLAGRRLEPVRWQYVRWHAWVYPHPTTELFRAPDPLPRYPDVPACREVDALRSVLDALAAVSPDFTLSHVIFALSLPHEATGGVCVFAGADRLNLYRFASAAAARDYVELQGAWFCLPFDTKLSRRRSFSCGPYVVESEPVQHYAEPTHTVRYPDNEIPWSALVGDGGEIPDWAAGLDPGPPAEGPFSSLLRHLTERRYDVVEVAFLPHSQQRVGTLSAVAATIEGDRFAVYRCGDERAAARVAAEVGHAIQEGPWVLRSMPVLMYADPHYEMKQLPDHAIAWSPLLENAAFRYHLQEFTRPRRSGRAREA
jgi:hypothetical protein